MPSRSLFFPTRKSIVRRAGFSLVELMIVVSVLSIVAAVLLPSIQPNLQEQLRAAAQNVAIDLGYGRGLAVANNSSYVYSFIPTENGYSFRHSGTNTSLNVLPSTPFYSNKNTSTTQRVYFSDMPGVGTSIRLHGIDLGSGLLQATTDLEFGSMGQTTNSGPTVIWLTIGINDSARYIPVMVNPVTGLARVGTLQGKVLAADVVSNY